MDEFLIVSGVGCFTSNKLGGDPDLLPGIFNGIFTTLHCVGLGNCKNFVRSAALAEVCGLRVLLVELSLVRYNVYEVTPTGHYAACLSSKSSASSSGWCLTAGVAAVGC